MVSKSMRSARPTPTAARALSTLCRPGMGSSMLAEVDAAEQAVAAQRARAKRLPPACGSRSTAERSACGEKP